MGKKRANARDGVIKSNDATTPNNTPASATPNAAAGTPTGLFVEDGSSTVSGGGWTRLTRGMVAALILGGLAMTDPLMLKESVTVAAPEHQPLLAIVFVFAWLVWRQWNGSGRRGLHPVFRTMGFLVILAAGVSLLPFNSTVTMYEVPLLTGEECDDLAKAVGEAVSSPGFFPIRTRYDAASEVPLEDISPEVSGMVLEALRQRLVPFVRLEFGGQGTVTLDEEHVYVEHYQPHHKPSPPAHLRPRQLSARVELTPPESTYVGGGSVVLASMGRSITPGTGSALVIPAKLRHGSSEAGEKTRSVLVATLTVTGRDPWQQFVGVWRLWGLFSRRVRYVADKRLKSSGVDTIPVLEEPGLQKTLSGDGDDAESSHGINTEF